MSRIIVGISANEKPVAPDIDIVHLSSSRNFADGIKRAGGLPVYLPVSTPEEARAYVQSLDALILTGGQDVHFSHYSDTQGTEKNDYSLERDWFELALLEEALRLKKPVFAVCRGMQLLNVHLGGTLDQEISNHSQGMPIGTYHTVEVEKDSHLASLLTSGSRVNSVHHQAIDQLGQGLKVVAKDPRDGIIEALELPGYPVLAVQWHPEFLIEDFAGQQALFDDLVKKAYERK